MSSDSLLPDNASTLERSLDGAGAARVDLVPAEVVSALQNPDAIPANLLPWLAWAFSVDEWDVAWTEAQKRASIAASFDVHRHKGTIGAVRSALNALGLELTLVEWFQDAPPADPYTFRLGLTVSQTDTTQDALAKVLQVVEATKNLRSHLSSVDVSALTKSSVFVGAASGMGHEITIASGDA